MTNDFDKNGYVHLEGFLNKNNCEQLTTIIKQLVAEDKTVKDEQCPLSEAVHGSETFDQLLLDLLPHFEKACGKRLYPTYSYARLYKPGEKLKKHTDRHACEISATITLGFEGDVWSFFVNNNKVDMEVGDAVLYKGYELKHWRNKYVEGKWQTQVFLHYVDADGPYAEWKYDKRPDLGIAKLQPKEMPKTIYDCSIYAKHITNSFCDNIINTYKQDNVHKDLPYIGKDDKIDLSIRNTERVVLSTHQGIGATLTASALLSNNTLWKYDITHANQTELLIYKPEGHYSAHVDTVHQHSNETRKLTALAFLNDDFEGGKFYIANSQDKYYPPQSKGTVIVFPSFMLHGVEPVTKGVRYSCVTWLVGPYFK